MIVTSSYPKRPLVDTTVFISAWTTRHVEPTREDCIAFLEGVEANDGVILVAAPTIAELLRGTPPLPLPRRKSIAPVPFDAGAAEILGRMMGPKVLKAVQAAGRKGLPLGYFKYDAMIVACAKAHRAECIVSLDDGMRSLAQQAGVPFKTPSMYRRPKQASLDLPKPTARQDE